MKKLNDKKISVLAATALTVSLVMPTVQMIPAEETEVLDQYMIIELEPLAKLEVDVQQTENSSEEQSTEEFSEVVSDSDTDAGSDWRSKSSNSDDSSSCFCFSCSSTNSVICSVAACCFSWHSAISFFHVSILFSASVRCCLDKYGIRSDVCVICT